MAGRRVLSAPTWVRFLRPLPSLISQGLAGEERSLIRIDSRDRHPDLRPFLACVAQWQSVGMWPRRTRIETARRFQLVHDLVRNRHRDSEGRSLAWPKHPVPTRRSRVRILPPLPSHSGRSRSARHGARAAANASRDVDANARHSGRMPVTNSARMEPGAARPNGTATVSRHVLQRRNPPWSTPCPPIARCCSPARSCSRR